MAQTKVQVIIDAVDNASGVLKGMGKELGTLESNMKTMAIAGTAVGVAAGLAAKALINQAGAMEQNIVAFETMLGSAAAATTLLDEIRQFAKLTPFNLTELVEGSKRLLAYNVEAKDLIPTLEILGNITAGVGREKLPQLILAFGQVKAATRLTGAELRQFSEAGVPLLATLADQAGVTAAEMVDLISEGKVGFPQVEAALAAMTVEGGKFNNLMQKQSQTTLGKISNLEDSVQQLQVTMGNALLPALNDVVDSLIPLTEKFGEYASAHPEVIANSFKLAGVLGTISAGYLALIPVLKVTTALLNTMKISVLGVGNMFSMAMGLGKVKTLTDSFVAIQLGASAMATSLKVSMLAGAKWVATGLAAMGQSFIAFSATLLASPITWIILAIIAVIALLVVAWKNNWGDIQGKTKAAIEAIGGWLETAKAWIVNFANSAKEKFDGFIETIKAIPGKIGEAFMGFVEKIRAIPETIKAMFDAFIVKVDEFKQSVIEKFEDFKQKVMEFFTWDNLMQIWSDLWYQIGFVVGNVFATLLIDIPTYLGQLLAAFWAWVVSVGEFLAGLLVMFVDWMLDLGLKMVEFFTITLPEAWNAFTIFMTEKVPELARNVVAWFVEMAQKAWEAIYNFATVTVPNAITSLIKWLSVEIPKLKENFIKWITEMAQKVWEWIIWMKDNAITTITTMIANIIAGILAFINNMISGFKNMVSGIASALWALPGQVAAAFQSVKEKAVAKAIEIYNGVKEWFDKIVGFFDNIIGKAGEAINKAKEAFSLGFSSGSSRQTGGTIPGAIGEAVPVTMHAGERVIPAGVGADSLGSGSGGASIVFNVSVGLYAGTETEKRNIARDLYAAVLQVAQAQNKTVAEMMGG